MDESRKTDERYTTAITTDNLKMDTREHASIGDVDVLTAAAWAPARLGSALLRLASEYARPVRLQGMSASDHRGPDGWHGTRLRWKLRRINEIQAINETVKRAYQ